MAMSKVGFSIGEAMGAKDALIDARAEIRRLRSEIVGLAASNDEATRTIVAVYEWMREPDFELDGFRLNEWLNRRPTAICLKHIG